MYRSYTITLYAADEPAMHHSSTIVRESLDEAVDSATRALRLHRNTHRAAPLYDSWTILGQPPGGGMPKILAAGNTKGRR
jgi:hypothetical protein